MQHRTLPTTRTIARSALSTRLADPDHPTLPQPECSRFLRPYPEAEPLALPYHEFGLDVMALVGRPMPSPQYPRDLPRTHRPGDVLGPTPTQDRYDELRALATGPSGWSRCRHRAATQARRPQLMSATKSLDLPRLPLRRDPARAVATAGPGGPIDQGDGPAVPITGVVSDGRRASQGGGQGP